MKVSWPHWAMRFTPHDTNEAGLHVRAPLYVAIARRSPLAKRKDGLIKRIFWNIVDFFTFFR
jgi:DNA polymerase IIIc chi subunit